jgi:hypothetical protein
MELRKITQKKSKKGQMDLISMTIFTFVLIIAGGILWFAFSAMNADLKADPDIAPHTEPLDQAEQSFGVLNWGPIALFVAMFLSLLISYYKVGSAPYWFFIHLVVLIILIIVAGSLSNFYYDLSIDEDLGDTFTNKMNLPSNLMFNLPLYLTIIGFISIIVLVTKWAKDKNSGGGLPGYY